VCDDGINLEQLLDDMIILERSQSAIEIAKNNKKNCEENQIIMHLLSQYLLHPRIFEELETWQIYFELKYERKLNIVDDKKIECMTI
jgi:hypothetical protein